jgi:hypothetical protein
MRHLQTSAPPTAPDLAVTPQRLTVDPAKLRVQPLKTVAIAIIAGLIAQGPLVLLAMPALYKLLGGARRRSGVA